jgi:glycine dehydrogenase subunit 1
VANASMWDGSTATTEAVLMAERLTGRRRFMVAQSVHPEYRQVLATYARNLGIEIELIGFTASGQIDMAALEEALRGGEGGDAMQQMRQVAAVVVQSPNFFGVIEPVARIAKLAHAVEALAVVAVAEGVSLGIVRPPAEADIVAMEAQSFGMAPSYGGPYAGVIATREKYVRQLPGRLAGETTDAHGRRGFCLTLATREQHIRRERATSNICTNHGLVALAATVYLSVLGKSGLRRLARLNLERAHRAAALLCAGARWRPAFSGPFFNEFAVRGADAAGALDRAEEAGVLAGVPLGRWYPELDDALLIAVTELHDLPAVERLAAVLEA